MYKLKNGALSFDYMAGQITLKKNGKNFELFSGPVIYKMQTQSTDSSEDREPFAEVNPTGRYGRYPELLGSGAVNNVYRGFDPEEGRDIAWNQVKLRN
ncbi:protein kinase-like domain-containing protein [Artemisia annua]|uniref:non-specific serine/threonine protein kinase n=1 Tax=Artemisia annua TaxID=35608 RepID=A0A2U1NZA4_ARTAN|nr:protein kinase-like domain-containing protein [Artemisia annua]